MDASQQTSESTPDWEAFYRDYRKPGYVTGFEISSKLGGGMFGLVFKASKQSIGKDYAIKFLKVDDGQVRRAVIAELDQVQHFAQIDHPNLVSIEDRGEVDGIPYLIMAYAGAETLSDRLPVERQDRAELVRLFAQACRGVAALHERSLVHFDLKPANVFLKGGVARVGDYGLSKLMAQGGGSLSMGRGTPYYMAPEMLESRGDHRSDIYSLGVMLYEILCGKVPFLGENEWEILRKHESAELEFPDDVGPRERAVVERCMAKDAAKRFDSVHDLVAVLAPLVGGDRVGPESVTTAAAATAAADKPPVLADGSGGSAVLGGQTSAKSGAREGAAEFVATAWQSPGDSQQSPMMRWLWLLLLLLLVFFLGLTLLSSSSGRSPVDWAMPGNLVIDRVGGDADPVRSRLREYRDVIWQASFGVPSVVRPGPLDPELVDVPVDLDGYLAIVDGFVQGARAFSPPRAQLLVQEGYPMMVAAVAWLQRQDYTDRRSCHEASLVLQYLEQLTSVSGFVVSVPLAEPTPAQTRRFAATAAVWRSLLSEFCTDEAAFRTFVQDRGESAGR